MKQSYQPICMTWITSRRALQFRIWVHHTSTNQFLIYPSHLMETRSRGKIEHKWVLAVYPSFIFFKDKWTHISLPYHCSRGDVSSSVDFLIWKCMSFNTAKQNQLYSQLSQSHCRVLWAHSSLHGFGDEKGQTRPEETNCRCHSPQISCNSRTQVLKPFPNIIVRESGVLLYFLIHVLEIF